jgi:hypothetical protein
MNVQEVINISTQRKNKTKEILKKVIENIHKKIVYYAKQKLDSCSYVLPALIDDYIIYDRVQMTKDIYKVLNEEGYIVSAYINGKIDISWNEKLVQQKVNIDKFILNQEEQRLNKYNKKNKIITDRFNFLANPNKVIKETSIDEQLDQKVEEILRNKEKEQKKYSKKIGSFNKI